MEIAASGCVQDEVRDDREPTCSIAFFGHDFTESTIIKRVTAFQANGARVVGFMFRRLRGGERPPSWENVDLGVTVERNYGARLPRLIKGLLTAWRHKDVLRQCDVFYARNIDMLLVAACARALSGSRARLGYEVLDVQRVFLGDSPVNRFFRWAERLLLRRCDLLIVSSPDFISEYFLPQQSYAGPWFLLENKVALSQAPSPGEVVQRSGLVSPPWVIGWFGILRCKRSLDILCGIADALGDKVSIQIRGIFSADDLTADDMAAALAERPNMAFGGAYRSPQDLPALYGSVHFSWCIDYLDAGTNSDWLLPNRLYEGGLMGSVAIAREVTATGRLVRREGLGWAFAEPLQQSVIEFLRSLTHAEYDTVKSAVLAKDRSMFIDERDTKALLAALCSGARVA